MKRCVPFAIACLAGLHACAPAAQPSVAPQPVPAAFPASGEGPSTGSLQWTQFFDDKELIYLIYDTLKGNPDLQMALQRVEIARSSVRQRGGALLPQLSAVGGAGVARWGRYTPEGAGNTTTDLTPGRAVPNPVGDFSAGLVASWEVDAWGKLRSERGAALARYLATAEARRVVQTVLISEVAATYFELLAWDVAREILQETIVRQRRAVEAAEDAVPRGGRDARSKRRSCRRRPVGRRSLPYNSSRPSSERPKRWPCRLGYRSRRRRAGST